MCRSVSSISSSSSSWRSVIPFLFAAFVSLFFVHFFWFSLSLPFLAIILLFIYLSLWHFAEFILKFDHSMIFSTCFDIVFKNRELRHPLLPHECIICNGKGTGTGASMSLTISCSWIDEIIFTLRQLSNGWRAGHKLRSAVAAKSDILAAHTDKSASEFDLFTISLYIFGFALSVDTS